MLRDVLSKYDLPFDITLGTFKTEPVGVELYPDAKPYHTKIGVLRKVNKSDWLVPAFIQPKNNGAVIFLSYITAGEILVTKTTSGVFSIPYIFQGNIPELFEGLYMVLAYIDDILVIIKTDFTEHLKTLKKVLHKSVEAGLKLNVKQSSSGCT